MKLILNPDIEFRNEVLKAVKDNDGYCPCLLTRSNESKCKCKEARENNNCHCGLFVQVEE